MGTQPPFPKNRAESHPTNFGPCLLCQNGWMDQDATWYGGRPRPTRHCFRWRPSSPFPKRGTKPRNCRPIVYCGQTAAWNKMPLGMVVGLGPGHIVLDGDPAPIPKRGHSSPQSWAHVCCGQSAGWIKRPLGTKVGLGPDRIVLHEDPAPPLKRGTAPSLRPMSTVTKRSPISKYLMCNFSDLELGLFKVTQGQSSPCQSKVHG